MKLDDFKCRMCGACCRIKDGIVRVSDTEIARIAAFLGMERSRLNGPIQTPPKSAWNWHDKKRCFRCVH